jgi:hypothetical protein
MNIFCAPEGKEIDCAFPKPLRKEWASYLAFETY